MAINFPDSPATNETHSVGSNTWVYDGEKWILVGETIALDDLSDVSASAPNNGDFLKWDGSNWVADGIPTINYLDDIGDVDVSTASVSQVLTYNGTNWVNQNPSVGSGNLDGGTAVTIYGGIFALSGGSA